MNYLLRKGIKHGRKAYIGPSTAHISICDHCNLDCVMCWDHHPGALKPPHAFMSTTMFEELLIELSALNTKTINLVGTGEPLLHPEIKKLLQLLNQYDVEVSILTSGIPIGIRIANLLKTLKLHLQISLHGGDYKTWKAIHPNSARRYFDRLHNTLIELSHQHNIKISLHNVISRTNFKGIDAIVDFAVDVGASRVTFELVDTIKQTSHLKLKSAELNTLSIDAEAALKKTSDHGISSNLKTFQATLTEYESSLFTSKAFYSQQPCYIGWVWTSIERDGTVTPCCNSQYSLGNIQEMSFKTIWNSKQYQELRHMAKSICTVKTPVPQSKCWNCSLTELNRHIHSDLK